MSSCKVPNERNVSSVDLMIDNNCDYDYTYSSLRDPLYITLFQILKTYAFEHAINVL